MTQGYSGGFFLPAQRSVHCKGGFFASATRAPTATSNVAPVVAKNHPQPQFPVLFTLPQAGKNAAHTGSETIDTSTKPKSRSSRVYDPDEGDEDVDRDAALFERVEQKDPEQPERTRVQRSNSTSRFVRGRQHTTQSKKDSSAESRSARSAGTAVSNDTTARPKQSARSSQQQPAKPKGSEGDINNKFELAMKELNEIKGEFELKQQRQTSAPSLMIAHDNRPLLSPSARQIPAKSTQIETLAVPPPSIDSIQSTNQQQDPPPRDLQSPRQRLQVAEMVMRKLYTKNLQTEQELASVKATNEQILKKLADFEAGKPPNPPAALTPTTTTEASAAPSPQCAKCTMNESIGFVLANPPSRETISRIDQQQLDYLRHLAAEQDRTITSLKIRIEELSTQLVSAKQQHAPHTPGATAMKTKSTTPRQVVNKLQSKLQDARQESERQKSNYLKLKRDFQHLLALKTKTLYENPQALNASARGLVELMEKQLKKLEVEHSVDLAGYNSKLYEIEQQSCESYAQKRMMEEEMERVAKDVQQRDAIDVEIEQCIANVFERLHHVESENLHLKTRFSSVD